MRPWLVVGLLLGTVGCGDGGTDCTAIAVSSITLTLVDPEGVEITDATVTFTVDNGELQDCESWDDGSYVCGWEQAGDFDVFIEAPGYAPDNFERLVEADECHVMTKVVERQLEPVML